MVSERPSTRFWSVTTTSVPPSKVRPRRRNVLEPTSAHTSSTMTVVVSSRLGRPGKPTGVERHDPVAHGVRHIGGGKAQHGGAELGPLVVAERVEPEG
jgi:hypothetical protein